MLKRGRHGQRRKGGLTRNWRLQITNCNLKRRTSGQGSRVASGDLVHHPIRSAIALILFDFRCRRPPEGSVMGSNKRTIVIIPLGHAASDSAT